MKKNIASSLLLLMGMLSCFGVFLFSFPFWDQILWLLYLPVLLLALLVFHQLLLHRKKKSIYRPENLVEQCITGIRRAGIRDIKQIQIIKIRNIWRKLKQPLSDTAISGDM